MRAALLLISLLFGGPMPDTAQADPAAESGSSHEYTELAELGARVIDLVAPALQCTTRGDLLAALDAGVLGIEYSPLALEYVQTRHLQAAIDSGQHLRDAALTELAALVGPAWRAELRQLVDRTAALIQRAIHHPTFVSHSVQLLTDDDSPQLQTLLSDPERPLTERQAALQYFRGFLCIAALGAAIDQEQPIPDQLTAWLLPLWSDSLRQFQHILERRGFAELGAEFASTPLAELMLRFQCCDGERLLALLHTDPSLPALLLELHERISTYFPDQTREHIVLRPSWSADTEDEDPALMVAIYTTQEVADAEASLERLDSDGWLDRSQTSSTPVIVDVRFT